MKFCKNGEKNMGIFNKDTNKLIWSFNGEKLVIEPWNENSLRVRSIMMGEVLDTDYALLPAKMKSFTAWVNISRRSWISRTAASDRRKAQ